MYNNYQYTGRKEIPLGKLFKKALVVLGGPSVARLRLAKRTEMSDHTHFCQV